MDTTTLVFEEKKLDYNKQTREIVSKSKFNILFIFLIIFFICSVSYSILTNFNWKPIITLEKFKRIKKNMNSWVSIVTEKTGIEVYKGRNLYLSRPKVSEWECLDFGNYYAPVHLSSSSYLPEFVRRGNSGPWLVSKATSEKDPSALQFCKFLINKYVVQKQIGDNLITCGLDMFDKLGYSGYFSNDSPCEKVYGLMIKKSA